MPEFRKLIEAVNESVRENSRLLREAAEREERARTERIAQWEKERKEREEAEKRREEAENRREAKREAEREKERKEAERIMRKSDTRIDRMVDMFTTQWGKLVEALCKPAALKLFKKSGIGVNQIYKECAHGKDPISGEDRVEIDVLYENNHVMVATEVKTTCSKSDVDEFIAKMENFKTYFKVFADKTVYGAMAAIKYTQSADKYAQKKGLFVLTFSGEDTFTMSEPGTRKMF